MELKDIKICILYASIAPYGGNFMFMIRNFIHVMKNKYGISFYFVIPPQEKKEWTVQLESSFSVAYIDSRSKDIVKQLISTFDNWGIDVAYSHHGAYDIPLSIASTRTKKKVKMIWHLHDYMSLDKTGLNFKFIRKVGTHLRMLRKYGWYGRKAYFIGVSSEVTNFVTHYRDHIFSFPKQLSNEDLQRRKYSRATVLLNGLDPRRFTEEYIYPSGTFTFLTYGGESYSKGIPCIFDAAESLYAKGYTFRILITRGYTTDKLLSERFGGVIPNWLKVTEPIENIAHLFNQAHCYISASLKETMSMGIAEASVFGLPVIQSDIPGTWWNADTPSAFLFKLNDANDLADKMIKVMDMPREEMRRLCSKSQEINKNRLSMEKWCNKMVEIFEEL